MTFKKYLTASRGEPITPAEAREFLTTNADQSYGVQGFKFPMYRGTGYGGHASSIPKIRKVDPSKFERQSANTTNLYTLLIDNSPQWEGYPKRSQSLICTTSYGSAENYGLVTHVFPEDHSKIGVCPKDDFWESFPYLEKRTNIATLDIFNMAVMTLLSIAHNGSIEDGAGKPVGYFSEIAKKIDSFHKLKAHLDMLEGIIAADGGIPKFLKHWRAANVPVVGQAMYTNASSLLLEFAEYSSILEALQSLLSPTKNGFRLIGPRSLKLEDYPANEVWTDAESILLTEEGKQKVKDENKT